MKTTISTPIFRLPGPAFIPPPRRITSTEMFYTVTAEGVEPFELDASRYYDDATAFADAKAFAEVVARYKTGVRLHRGACSTTILPIVNETARDGGAA